MHFYPAYKLDELAGLPKRTLEVMWECITIIEAQNQLKDLTSLDFPNMKKPQRQKLHKELYKLAYPSDVRSKNYITADDLKKLVGR
jgi:hypothetical protein